MNLYVKAIQNVTHYEPRMIRDTIDGIERGIEPIKVVGSRYWDVYIIYKAIREYERIIDAQTIRG